MFILIRSLLLKARLIVLKYWYKKTLWPNISNTVWDLSDLYTQKIHIFDFRNSAFPSFFLLCICGSSILFIVDYKQQQFFLKYLKLLLLWNLTDSRKVADSKAFAWSGSPCSETKTCIKMLYILLQFHILFFNMS